jgi:hypothetical protein
MKRCFIIGNGPSINDLDLTPLKKHVCFTCNWMIQSPLYNKISPQFYCTYDEAFLDPKRNQRWVKLVKQSDSELIFPTSWKGKFDFLKNRQVSYLPLDLTQKLYDSNKDFSPHKTLYDGGSVIINLAIPAAILKGYTEIILLGCDNDYFPSESFSPYFYSFNNHDTKFSHDLDSNQSWALNTNDSYKKIHDYTQRNNIEILNGSSKSKIKAFSKIKLSDYFMK